MRIGPYRHRVQILSRTQGLDDFSAPLPDGWQVIATVWAAIEPLKRGHEFFAGDQTQSVATYDIRMRYRADLTTDMHIQHNGIYYNIDAVLQDNRCRETIARCHVYSFEQYDQEEPDTTTTEDVTTEDVTTEDVTTEDVTTTEEEPEGW